MKKIAPAADAAQRIRKARTVGFVGPNRLKLPKIRVNQNIRMKMKGKESHCHSERRVLDAAARGALLFLRFDCLMHVACPSGVKGH